MSTRVNELFFFDIYIAILKIKQVVKKFNNSQELLNDYVCWDSIVREFEILGEATSQLIKIKELEKFKVDF